MSDTKPTNPKDAMGIKKVPSSPIPAPVIAELGLGMMEGALKYGRHNFRVIGVRASVYFDATKRHLDSWWEGEDTDPDSGLSHVSKAIASLVVLRDAMIQRQWVDDRPPPSPSGWLAELNAKAEALLAKYPNPVPAYVAADKPAPSPNPPYGDPACCHGAIWISPWKSATGGGTAVCSNCGRSPE